MRLPDRTGFRGKTLWDWLQLLIVPAILVGVTFTWSASQTRSDNKREDRRIAADRAAAEEGRQAATLQGYLGEMSGLMLRENLLKSNEGSAVQAVARTVTLTALRRLDGERKAAVARFLYEAGLLGITPSAVAVAAARDTVPEAGEPLVRLGEADLSGANLEDAYLPGASLEGADLKGANLADAYLIGATLGGGSDLSRAQLARAQLGGADLANAYLVGANLYGTYLFEADLRRADLRGASLAGAHLDGLQLGGANLAGADLEGAELGFAELEDADPERAGARPGRGPPPERADARFGRIGPSLQQAAGLVEGLDLDRYIADLTPKQQKQFLDSQEAFLDSLSPQELSKFKLTPEKLAKFRREARRS